MVVLDDLLALDLPDLADRLCALTPTERVSLRKQRDGREDFDNFLNAIEQRGQRLVEIAVSQPGMFLRRFSLEEWRVVFSRPDPDVHTIVSAYLNFAGGTGLRHGGFSVIRAHERAGRIRPEHDDVYVAAMISDLTGSIEPRSKPDVLRDDPELLDDTFWRIFDVDDIVQVSLANADRWDPDTWHDCVLSLLADGTIDRPRVIDRTLAGLTMGTVAFRTAWFARLHDALALTVHELSTRQGAYAELLRAPLGSSVTLALRCLERVLSADRLDAQVALGGLTAAVHVPAKATAVKALRLAAGIALQDQALEHSVGVVLAAALDHHQADVQQAALKYLMRLDTEHARKLTLAHVDTLAPGPASTAREWLGHRKQAHTLLVEAPTVPPVPAMLPVEPITDPAELVESFAVLLENPTNAELGERCLCAAARLGADPIGYTTLAKRARRRLAEPSNWHFATPVDLIATLILAAAGDDPIPREAPPNKLATLILTRAAEVSELLRARERRQLVAEPTHMRGWIDASALPDRLAPGRASRVDLTAARLRVWPQSGLTEDLTERLGSQPLPLEDLVRPGTRHASGWLSWIALATPADIAGIARLAFSPETDDEVLLALSTITASPLDIPEDAALLLAGSLASQSALVRASAVDAAIALVPHRLSAEELATAAARLGYRSGWANGFRELSTAGHSQTVQTILTQVLPVLTPGERHLNRLAELLLDEHIRQQSHVTDERLRAWLDRASRGSTRLAKAARQLLSLA